MLSMNDIHRANRFGATLWLVNNLGDRKVIIVCIVIGLALWYKEWESGSAFTYPPWTAVLPLLLAAGGIMLSIWGRLERPAAELAEAKRKLAATGEQVDLLLEEFTAIVSAGEPVDMPRFKAAVSRMMTLSGELGALEVVITVSDGGEAGALEAAEKNKETLFRLAYLVHAEDIVGARDIPEERHG